ncbi:hypothetical protein [Oceanisphaera sp. IT1-181]|uniref:hypothetical protein n=1 Tax=Oceanisphaera sp. IT1-181 TaxID=3081199 RepID=UPI0029CA381F|nr:hypothetical protein [Oceanisphaera sp. IT1-181]
MNNILKISALSVTVLLTVACTGTPTKGDQMLSHSASAKDIGKMWNEGNKLVKKGEKLQAKGERQVDDGQDDIKKGQDLVDDGKDNIKEGKSMVREGQQLLKQSEAQYSAHFPSGS